jgi:hypothetical protein
MTVAEWSTSWFDIGVVQKTMLAWRGVSTPHQRLNLGHAHRHVAGQ